MALTRPFERGWGVALLGFSFVAVYAGVLADLARDWLRDENYSHGVLVIPAAAYLAWRRRRELAALRASPSVLGALLVAGSLVLLLIGTAGVEFFVTRISMLGVLVGSLAYLVGWAHVRVLAFPLAFLGLMIPLPTLVFNQIAFPLQLIASRFGVGVLQLSDVPVLREGNVIVLATTTLEVAEACSGIRSLISLLTVALLYSYFTDGRVIPRVIVAAFSIPIAVFANALRVAATGLGVHYYGASVTTGFAHDFSGWLVFAASLAMVIGVAHVVSSAYHLPMAATLRLNRPAES